MRNGGSYKIALSGIATAAGVVFLILASYLPVARLGMLACSTVALFVPFSMGMAAGGLMSYAATAVLAFFLGGGEGPVIAAAYACFFGLQPLLIYLFRRFSCKLVLRLVVSILFAATVIFVVWKFVGLLELFTTEAIPIWLLEAVGIPIFLAYEYLMERVYFQIGRLCERFGRN